MRRPVNPPTKRLLPVKPVGNVVAFKIVSAGQAQKRRMHCGQLFHQVNPVSL